MKVCVLASGSKGNCTYIETDKTKTLVDVGMSTRYIENSLNNIGVNPDTIDQIFITHTHSDHINGLKVFIKKHNPKIYLTEKMDEELDIILDNYEYITEDMQIDDLDISVIKTSHDVADSNGYIFKSNEKTIAYITDTGYIHNKNHDKLKNHNVYIMESNHDVEMLMNGNYPHHLKVRILSDKGHLSNKDSAYYLSSFVTEKTSNVVLAHLSEENNTKEKAKEEYYKALEKFSKKAPNLIIANQKEQTEVIEI